MASSRLYKDAHVSFVEGCKARYRDKKDREILQDFLQQHGSPEEAQAAAQNLKSDANQKWGGQKMGDVEIPQAWIDKVMANIQNFIAVGNFAMQGAPESIGLAWFGFKLTLSAIQSNYALYNLFGSGLTDISEIMIITLHYDSLYDERSKTKAKAEWKNNPVVDKLFTDIISMYIAVLDFSLSVRRHLSAGTLAKVRHGFKDFFGASEAKFRGKLDDIASVKRKILDDSQAIFQDKSLQQLGTVRDIVSNIESTVNQIKDFQGTLQKMREEQAAQLTLLLKKMEDITAIVKHPTPWDLAIKEFDKNKDVLKPQDETIDALGEAIDRRFPDTCLWIFDQDQYKEWRSSNTSSLLCLTGRQGSGKSTVLATVVQHIDQDTDDTGGLIYLSYGSIGSTAATGEKLGVEDVLNTLLFRLYQFAREDKNNVKLLEDCNKVFVNPKADKVEKSVAKSEKKVKGPDFVDAFLAILERLKISIVVALDQVDSLSSNAQQELASKLKAVLTSSTRTGAGDLAIKILVGCRSGTRFFDEMDSTGYLLDVEAFSDDDISKKLLDSLKKIPALSSQEQEEAKDAILRKAGSRFDYVNDIAIPFMREPFRRPLSERLLALPEGMNNIYIEALRKMRPNYIDLLRSALKWSLWAPVPVPVEVIMDAYQGTYKSHDPLVEEEAIASNNETFRAPSDLEIKQLRDAGRAFLRVVKSPDTYDHLVELIDPPRIREFCAHAEQAGSVEGHSEGVVCARCKSSLAETKALSLVERDVHLELALVCLRHLNHPIFQKFATAGYPDEQPQLIQSEVSNAPPTPGGGDGLDSESEKVSSADAAQTEKDESKNDERQENDSEKGAENLVAKTELPSNNPDEEGLGSERSSDVVGYDSDDSMEAEDYVKRSIDAQEEEESYFEEDNDVETGGRKIRYEASYWTYHFREADNSWTAEERQLNSTWAELMSEVNLFVVQNTSFFCHWQKILDIPSAPLKPLHVASYYGLTSWAEEILKAGGDPNEWSGSPERNALQAAARGVSDYPELRGSDNLPIMRILLEHGGDPNAESTEVIPAFHSWLSNDFTIEAVKLMLDHGADPAYQSQQDQFSIIHECAWGAQDAKVLPLLLDHTVNGLKADINALTSYGSNPLHLLLTRRDVPIPLLEAFIERGADVNKDDSSSARPLQLACIWGEFEALKVLCRDKQVLMMDDDDDMGNTAIHQAACGSHTDCIEFLVENGASIDAQNKAGRTALHLCAWYGAKECVRILLSHGANANITDKHGRTPLFFACHGNSPEIASILLDTLVEKKVPVAAVNTLTKRRRCVLRHAADRGFDQIVERIISMAQEQDDLDSLSINEADTQKGMTALHRAALSGHTRCVELLLAENLKADATATDKDGKTPLVRAYEQWTLANDQEEYEKIISILISKAPQVAISDAELIAHCAANGSEFLLRQLADLGADLKRQDRYGWTPLELARRFRRTVVEQYLTQQAAWADLLPSQWARDERLKISEDGKRLEHLSGKRFCISTDKPLPAGLDTFYFEVSTKRIGEETNGGKSQPQYPEIAVGFCTIGGAAIQFPGWMPREDVPSARSWGYHGDDGGLYNSSQSSYEEMRANQFFGPQYQPGDTVGCGVNLTKGEIWFTRNGEKMEKGFDNVQGRLFPLLGLRHKIVVETNFEGPFLWQSNP